MPFDYHAALAAADRDLAFSYSDTQIMLYALAIGMARDPLDSKEIDFVYEKSLKIVPTAATVLAWGARDIRKLGVDYAQVLHGEQSLTLHAPLPPSARLRVDTRTKAIYDKGRDKGALIVSTIDAFDAESGQPLFSQDVTHFARGDGGFREHTGVDCGVPPAPHALPRRAPDLIVETTLAPNQALLYRLLGDRNILHADTQAARTAGFEKPILHGLCTYGVCCYAIMRTVCDYDPTRITRFDARFSAPIFPGETLCVSLWQDGPVVSFTATAKERGVTVINNGYCLLQPPGQALREAPR
jgi:acyl dehydratase